jgi:hypothetical protein
MMAPSTCASDSDHRCRTLIAALFLAIMQASAAATPAASTVISGRPCVPDITLASMFGSEAVLQRAPATPVIHGTAPLGAVLDVAVAGHVVRRVAADQSGAWTATLPAHPEGWGVPLTVTAASAEAATLSCSVETRVNFGETVLCSGQSNMGMPVVPTSPCCFDPPPRNRTCKCFAAQNGTAEVAAAGRYTGKIVVASVQGLAHNGTYCPYPWTNHSCVSQPEWNAVVPGKRGTIAKFSAICWYTGVALFESLRGQVPVGLISGAVGGSPIEFWLPPGHVNNTGHCGIDAPPCDHGGPHEYRDSDFWSQLIRPFAPYTIGSVVWDQGERDAHCLPQIDKTDVPENHVARYACLLRSLVTSWRAAFDDAHPFQFLAIQLPGYLGDCGTYEQCRASVFPMRLQQQAGLVGLDSDAAMASVTPTYDLSCPPGVDFSTRTDLCPFGSVHNVFKRPIGFRVASQIIQGIRRRQTPVYEAAPTVQAEAGGGLKRRSQWPGPRLVRVNASSPSPDGMVMVMVTYDVPLAQIPTLNCVACCSQGPVGDFDASVDGVTWLNGSRPVFSANRHALLFKVAVPRAGPIVSDVRVAEVRYTANQPYPQCAIYAAMGGEEQPALRGNDPGGIPAMPFHVVLTSASDWVLVEAVPQLSEA